MWSFWSHRHSPIEAPRVPSNKLSRAKQILPGGMAPWDKVSQMKRSISSTRGVPIKMVYYVRRKLEACKDPTQTIKEEYAADPGQIGNRK